MNDNNPHRHHLHSDRRRRPLPNHFYRRQASLSEVERSFLSHLLIDDIIPPQYHDDDNVVEDDEIDDDDNGRKASSSSSSSAAYLNENILFSLPIVGLIFSSSIPSSSSSSSSALLWLMEDIASSERDSLQRRKSSLLLSSATPPSAKNEDYGNNNNNNNQARPCDLWRAHHHGRRIMRRQRGGGTTTTGENATKKKKKKSGAKEEKKEIIQTRRFWQRRERRSSDIHREGGQITDNDVKSERKGRGVMNIIGDKDSTTSDAFDNDSPLLTRNNDDDDDNNEKSGPPTDNDTGFNNNDYDKDEDDDNKEIQSDNEVGTIHDESSASSWNSSQGGFDHYDAWEVMHDEYAPEFGYQVAEEEGSSVIASELDDDDQQRPFKILGTSAYDASALPHVLSPPLMDSLLNFVPEHLWNCNYWLKYSLVRDGASLDILRRYCRAATHTILAIETTNGDVFGSFTSSAWTCRRHRQSSSKFYGTGESFLWRMRSNRNAPVHSLFEQAQLESEIDVFPYNGSNDYIQLCTRDMLALGGGEVGGGVGRAEQPTPLDDDDAPPVVLEEIVNYGFGLALDKYLLHGTTSPSATFGNSNLTSHRSSIENVVDGGVTFDVKNLEVWGFTSANTVADAQKSEMSMYFARESMSSSLTSHSSFGTSRNSFGGRSDHQLFEADDLSQNRFYRRIGRDDENEVDRTAWQYANMMNPVAGSSPYGTMGSSSPYGR